MSINNIGGINPDNINPNNRRNVEENSVVQNNDNTSYTPAPASAYRQFMVNNHNYDVTFEKANDNEEDMHAIYDIDREAFADLDSYSDYDEFKNFIDNSNISVYSLKDNTGEIIGYYNLEPIKNGDLYIDSIGLKPQYRNSRKGYAAIMQAWDKINDYARENDIQTMSLHVDSTNPRLKRMYEQFGFVEQEYYDNYYQDGIGAYFMVKPCAGDDENGDGNKAIGHEGNKNEDMMPVSDVGQAQTDNDETDIRSEFSPQQPTLTAEEIYAEKVEQAKQRLEDLQIPEKTGIKADSIIKSATVKKRGQKAFNNEVFDVAIYVAELCKDLESNYWKSNSFNNIIKGLKEKDNNGNITIRSDVIPYLQRLNGLGIATNNLSDILNVARTGTNRRTAVISTNELDKIIYLAQNLPQNQRRKTDDIAGKCKLRDENGNTYISREVIDAYNKYMRTHDSDYHIDDVFSACTTKNEDGSDYFNKDAFNMLNRHFGGNQQYGHPSGIYAEHVLKYVYEQDVPIDFYMDRAPRIKNDEVFSNILRQYNTKESVGKDKDDLASPEIINMAAILKAISYRTYEEKTDYLTGEKHIVPEDHIDLNAQNTLREYCKNGIPFKNILSFAKTMSACKERTSPYLPEKFNPEILKKAIQLKETGIDEKEIPAIMEACKFEEIDPFDRKIKLFNDEMFEHILSKSSQNPNYITAEKVKISKDFVNGKNIFRPEVFDAISEKNIYKTSEYQGGLNNFQIKCSNGDKKVNVQLLQAWLDAKQPEVRLISDEYDDVYIPNGDAIEAYKTLRERHSTEHWEYNPDQGGESDPVKVLMYQCMDNYNYTEYRWNNKAFQHAIELKDKGYSVKEINNLIYNCKEFVDNNTVDTRNNLFIGERYDYAMSLIEQGIDITNAGKIAAASIINGKMPQPENAEKMLELYSLGSKDPVSDLSNCKDITTKEVNDTAYERMKDVLSRGLESSLISECRDKGEFSDRLYHYALDLQKRGYSSNNITNLMKTCHLMSANGDYVFQQNMYDHIKDLEDIGINQENILTVLQSAKYNNSFSEKAFSKVSELHNKGYDDKGIAVFLKNSSQDNKFFEPKYNNLLELTEKHKDLRDANHGDNYIITKLSQNKNTVNRLKNVYGEDVNNYAISMKIDGYINFASQCSHLLEKFDSKFNNDLQSRLNELPFPELKVKRLRVIGGLSYNLDQDALNPLINLIKSPKMTEGQIELANNIFTSTDGNYEDKVEEFIEKINTPNQYKQTVRDFLLKERLDKSIERQKSIEEQKAQMEKNAQQMLINPKIPLDKKIVYIDEYKAKIKDMEVNPDKYLKPSIYPKPLEKLKKVVEAYVNIPNDDTRFNNIIKETMYSNMRIETTPELLCAINYDSKYFDKMFAVQQGFKDNFKTLIELKKMNIDVPLREARLTMPEEGTEKYKKYERLGLIEQIKANIDSKRQIEEHNLNYDKWDSFDDNLRGETFTSEADPETEFKNLKYNVINIFQDELWNSIKPEETQKLMENLEKEGFKIFNNNLYRNGKAVTNSDIENFINSTVNYISNNEYWSKARIENVIHGIHFDEPNDYNENIPSEEIAGVTAFTDHIKGFQKRVGEIKNARTVSNIHFRLTDDDDIGRNIFFGNHVGCCNSVESSYAGYSAPMHLLNNYNRGIELVDEWGNSYGNSLCFFADVDDKLTFVIDSFEANGKLGSNPLVAEKLFEFAKQVCTEMGRPDAQIMVGPNYNNMDKSLLGLTNGHTIKVLGAVSERTYCDSVGGRVKDEINVPVSDRNMFVLN